MTDENNSITRLEEALGRLGAEHEPPAGWEDRVLGVLDKAEVDRPEPSAQPSGVLPWPGGAGAMNATAQRGAPPAAGRAAPAADGVVPVDRRASRRGWLPIAAVDVLGMAAAGACIVLGLASQDMRPSAAVQLELVVDVESVGPPLRAGRDAAHVGDIVHATAGGGAAHRALWVYHDEQLVVACPGAPDCRDAAGATTVDVVLRARGTYVIVAATSATALAGPRGSYDADAAAAETAGAKVRTARIEAR